MRAFLVVNPDDPATGKPAIHSNSSVVLCLPYWTKDGLPLFVLPGDVQPRYDNDRLAQTIDAPAGMVGRSYRGDVYVVDCDGDYHRLPVRVDLVAENQQAKQGATR
jgi:hypothetical protein